MCEGGAVGLRTYGGGKELGFLVPGPVDPGHCLLLQALCFECGCCNLGLVRGLVPGWPLTPSGS